MERETLPGAAFTHRFVDGDPSRTLLLLHGTGGDETDLLGLGRMLDPTASLLSPRGKVLENGMNRFFRRLAEGVFDVNDLVKRTHELAEWIVDAAAQYGVDPGNVWAAGFSNGANIAASMLLLRPGVLRGAVLLSPMVPLEPDTAPDLSSTPVFIGAGRVDPIATVRQTEALESLLRRYGANVDVHWTQAGHTLTRDEVDAAKHWLAPGSGLRA